MALIGNSFFLSWEVRMMEWIQANLGSVGLSILSFLSAFGEELLLVLLLGFLYWCWDKRMGKDVGLNVLMGILWNPLIKNIFLRRRPYLDHEGIRLFRKIEPGRSELDIAAQGFSFPSGHSTNAVTAYGSIARKIKKKWMRILAVLLTLAVGVSRVTVGAHYPTDVLCGWLLGLAVLFLIPFLRRCIPNTLAFYGMLLLTVLPGFFYCRSEDFFTGAGLLIGFMTGSLFEEKKVGFAPTRSIPNAALRIAGGLAVYLLLNTALKLPFPKEFLESGTTAALLVRTLRYAVIAFAAFGVYPLMFSFLDRRFPGTQEGKTGAWERTAAQ